MKILITGANSYIGTSFEKYVSTFENMDIATIDTNGDAWKKKDFSKYDSILHVAGIAHSDNGRITDERKRLYYAVNTDLAVKVAQKAKNDGVSQFVFVSSMSIFGESGRIGKHKKITAKTNPTPINAYGDSKLQAEKKLLPLSDDNFIVAITRPPMVYGKNCKGNYIALSKCAKKSPLFPNIDNMRSMIYIENLCEFIRLLIVNKESGIFMPQNNEYINTSQLVSSIAKTNGHKIVMTKIFNPLLKLFSPVVGVINKVFGNLAYDMEISKYKEIYCVCSFEESIKRTEQK